VLRQREYLLFRRLLSGGLTDYVGDGHQPQLSSSDWACQYLATAAGSPYTPGTAAAGALGVGVIDKLPKAPLGVAADATDDDVDDGGDAVSDEEHPATREIRRSRCTR